MSIEINIPDPLWSSPLANIVLDLEKLRSKELYGQVPAHIFFQLKEIFHMMETLGSARIEGNNTTLLEYIDNKLLHTNPKKDEREKEIENLKKAISYIEEHTDENTDISRSYISDLHKMVTEGLTPFPIGEGSNNPGTLRLHNVQINGSKHIPPDFTVLPDYFEKFIDFINSNHSEQYQLLVVAIAHHRFSYIHPFDNGNGRLGRLLNYALLIKLGFKVKHGRIINPSYVFYSDREKYYNMLSGADSLESKDVLNWCEYFLSGLKNEIEKIDNLLSLKYVHKHILIPALAFALERKLLTEREHKILKLLLSKENMIIKSEDLSAVGITNSVQKSRVMARLKKMNIIIPTQLGGRRYSINFVNNYLLKGVINSLQIEGFVSDFLSRNN